MVTRHFLPWVAAHCPRRASLGGSGVTRYPLGLTEAGSKRGNAAPLWSGRSRGRELCGRVIRGSTLPVNQLFPDETAGAPGSASGHCARPQCVAEEKAPAGPGCLPRAGGAGPGGAAQAEGTPGFVAEPVICSDLLPDKWPSATPPPPRSSTTSGRLGSYSNISRNLCRLRWTAAEQLKALRARPRP